jgi:alpha-glucosidase (family GH31 glycosyl hydrolase)
MACSRPGPPASPAGYRRAPDGSIGSTCEALYLAPDEHIYGLGEKFLPPDRRGQRVESWNFNTWGATNERAYKNVPFFVSSRGYGVFVNPAGTIARLRERGVRVCLWVQPWIPAESDQFAAGLEAGAFANGPMVRPICTIRRFLAARRGPAELSTFPTFAWPARPGRLPTALLAP